MLPVTWSCKAFSELQPAELYAILRLRNEVFVVEQNCVFQDADNKDQYCYHLQGYLNDLLVAYARLVPVGVSFQHVSIGRVVTSPAVRKNGLGRNLMIEAINGVYSLFGKQTIQIGAQLYLKNFYESLGFCQISEPYLEDDIPHIEMLLQSTIE